LLQPVGLASIAQSWRGRRRLQAPAPSPVRRNRSLVNAARNRM